MSEHATVFLRGRKVYLRPPHKETDLEFFQWAMGQFLVRRTLLPRLPISMAAEEKWFDRLADRPDIMFTICLIDGTPIGCTGLHNIHWISRLAETGTWIAPQYWGRGYGTEAKMLLLKYAFDTLNLRKIVSGAVAFNGRSIGHNRNCGYRITGRLKRHHFINGRYYDEVLLACFREWWWPKWRKYRGR